MARSPLLQLRNELVVEISHVQCGHDVLLTKFDGNAIIMLPDRRLLASARRSALQADFHVHSLLPRAQGGQGSGLAARVPVAHGGDGGRARGLRRRGLLLSRPRGAGEGRAPHRPLRPGLLAGLQGRVGRRRRSRPGIDRTARGLAEEARGKASVRRGEEADRGAWRLRQADGDAEAAAGRTEGPAPGRLEMDRHGRAPRPSAPMATIPKACASARRKAATGARSRCGTSGSSGTSTIPSNSARATSRWR